MNYTEQYNFKEYGYKYIIENIKHEQDHDATFYIDIYIIYTEVEQE